jgi:hypothetical protein
MNRSNNTLRNKRPIDPAAMASAVEHIAGMKVAPVRRGFGSSRITPDVIGKFWRFIGPINIYDSANNAGQTPTSGRVNAVAFDPAHRDTWYAGSSNGGVWKTTNAGVTWSPVDRNWPLLFVSSLAVDKTGKNIYAVTGDCPSGAGPGIG